MYYLLQCKTNFFIYLSFKEDIYEKLKNIYLGKPPLISKSFFDSFTLVYIRLHLSNDSPTLV